MPLVIARKRATQSLADVRWNPSGTLDE